MNLALDIFNYTFVAILIAVSATWIFLIRSMFRTFQETPFLDKFKILFKAPLALKVPECCKNSSFKDKSVFNFLERT